MRKESSSISFEKNEELDQRLAKEVYSEMERLRAQKQSITLSISNIPPELQTQALKEERIDSKELLDLAS